ncbi:ABC transporter permease [Streptomyces sp. RerS4]|uniref:ABC transporter permease n=1 Tax=Streptomyces sp. RerS4 TaxID=2942449 RepID=UPI00201C1BCE|nr:ABC transporter permease [Streptomyces sp. RerS4]UQW99660.1 ABC transporter permease [Streptomyces sp. RerS4]
MTRAAPARPAETPTNAFEDEGGAATPTLLPTMRAVWLRELLLFRRYWPAITFGSLIEPLVYMAGFGLGFSALVDSAEGRPYPQFVGVGMVVTSLLFASAFAGMFETYNRRCYQHLYDAVLSRPVDVWELVTAEASWIAVKSSVYSSVPLLVTLAIGLPASPTLLLVPIITLVSASAFALCGMWVSTLVPAIDWLRLVVSGVLTPLVMAAGVFFPLDGLPGWIQTVAGVNPIYHCMQLVRHAAFGVLDAGDWLHALVLVAFTALAWFLAVRGMSRRLLD